MDNDKILEYKNVIYPKYLEEGGGNKFIEASAKYFCKGKGLDIGGFFEWTLPGAIPINIKDSVLAFDAYKLPEYDKLDFIFSSHCLEHLVDPIKALEYWINHLREGGVLYLYLPHPDMEYWLPQNNKKHLHSWYPKTMHKIFEDLGLKNVMSSERDAYWSFFVVGFKGETDE